ncbi:type II toxin-antitoxin system PemK/MazF family toxin [Dietzia sp. Die43]|uniref:type II toxin-antitoxin system PemK/MazF family toxin n=1 Tax=Dietzia sp. Die43 TaxID=2926011 RepID=UPI0021181DAA|nr:type II toxin-antitoxin system PemK/MazF family toxin [Dietzia sp. Die43]
MPDPTPGEVIWVVVDPAVGREQSGRRPAVVVSSRAHISLADTLVMVVPVTSDGRTPSCSGETCSIATPGR